VSDNVEQSFETDIHHYINTYISDMYVLDENNFIYAKVLISP